MNQLMLESCVHPWDPKDVRSFLTLFHKEDLMMTLQGRNP